jgi:hypothetical protein
MPGIQNDSMIVLKTSNGGTNWSVITSPNASSKITGEGAPWWLGNGSIQAIGNTVAIASDCGRIFMSYDRGNTWLGPLATTLYQGSLSNVPKNDNAFVLSTYRLYNPGATLISTDNAWSFVSVDSLSVNIGITAFYSVYHGIGASFNHNDPVLSA